MACAQPSVFSTKSARGFYTSCFSSGSRVAIKCNPDVLSKLPKVAGKTGVVIETPKHPNTWFTIRIDDGPVIKLRKSALQPLYEQEGFSGEGHEPESLDVDHTRACSLEDNLNGELVVISAGAHSGRVGSIVGSANLEGYWCVRLQEKVGSQDEGSTCVIVKKATELRRLLSAEDPDTRIIYGAASILVQLMQQSSGNQNEICLGKKRNITTQMETHHVNGQCLLAKRPKTAFERPMITSKSSPMNLTAPGMNLNLVENRDEGLSTA